MKRERDIHTILLELCERGFIAAGKYAGLYKLLVKRSMSEVAQGLKDKTDNLFGTQDWG